MWGVITLPSSFASAELNQAALKRGTHKVQLGDVRIHYVVAGHGPLVFVTSVGWGLGATLERNCFKPLESNFTLVFVDERGNGESSLPADLKDMSTSIMADDLDRLRSYLGVDDITLMGHSGGGTIALEYAERYPKHLSKGIIIDARIMGDDGGRDTDVFLSLWKDDPKYKEAIINLARIPEHFKTDEEATESMSSYQDIYFSKPSIYVPIYLRQSGQDINVSAVTQNAHNEADQLANRQQPKDYGVIEAKLLIINGTVDAICPYQPAQRLHEAVPGSVLDLYANVGHFPYIEEPDRFIHEAAEFLSH
jgi:pimeloyl-ACP methyl ester carboxylesterase